MNRITAILLCVLLCISLAACSRNSEDIGSSLSLVSTYENDQAETTGNSETDETTNGNTTATESSAPDISGSDDSTVNNTTGAPTDASEPDTTEGSQTGTPNTPDIRPSGGSTGTGSNKTDTSKDADTSKDTDTNPSQTTTPPADTSTESKPTEETKPTETTKPSETEKPKEPTPPAEETKPEETKPPVEETKPEETKPQEPTAPYAYPFNIEQIRRNCIALGRSYGFILDESLTPNNSSWAGAETASSNTQGTRLKRLLTEMVEYYSPAYREDMGLPAVNITAFNIYCESTGNGTYRIYFLFLL